MKRLLNFALIAVFVAATASAAIKDDTRINEIRQAYAAAMERTAQHPYDNVNTNCITVENNRIMPATGLYNSTIRYYYTDDSDYRLNPDDMKLYLVTIDESWVHGRDVYHTELLYDEEGRPMFALMKVTSELSNPGEPLVWRFYFTRAGKVFSTLPQHIPTDKEMNDGHLYPNIKDPKNSLPKLFKYHLDLYEKLK